mmetsp:Transcript_63584/g.207388  ORF Transcript_63584/g.207388 Transcript_63584/m.207388 type:complete len:240 (+) Transcript_63584:92-811(+)
MPSVSAAAAVPRSSPRGSATPELLASRSAASAGSSISPLSMARYLRVPSPCRAQEYTTWKPSLGINCAKVFCKFMGSPAKTMSINNSNNCEAESCKWSKFAAHSQVISPVSSTSNSSQTSTSASASQATCTVAANSGEVSEPMKSSQGLSSDASRPIMDQQQLSCVPEHWARLQPSRAPVSASSSRTAGHHEPKLPSARGRGSDGSNFRAESCRRVQSSEGLGGPTPPSPSPCWKAWLA